MQAKQQVKDESLLRERLQLGLQQLSITLTREQQDKLLAYLALFEKWNKAYNLSAVRDIHEMLVRHILDSLSIVPFASPAKDWLDVGTGGGLPGIVLAICFPEKKFTLLDSNGKKTRFLFQVKTSLELTNVEIVQSRVERFQARSFDCIVSRAFASIADMVSGCEHLLAENGLFFAMKGQYPTDELSNLAKPYMVERCESLQVPFSEGERHLLLIRRQ